MAGVRLLVLGGGGFLGHHVVVAAQATGHEVTVAWVPAGREAGLDTPAFAAHERALREAG